MTGTSRRIVEGEIGGFPVPWTWPDGRLGRSRGRWRGWWRRGKEDQGPALKLVVVRSPDVERARRFYEALGIEFVEEQNGDEPVHLAASLPSGVVMELYRASDGQLPEPGSVGDVRLGFVVDDLDGVVQAVKTIGGSAVGEPGSVAGLRRVVVADPDGRRVELLDRVHADTSG